ncbi:MAG: ChaN family lipoprotein [Bdellovibrionaceae bacterium]|nr:ChaN family lipoprotein [Pseudobdellovibrionaceae bacterium]NUM59345.1 ChaN family lipoprotein [Pseudobdellovibrionaceae bacterium]
MARDSDSIQIKKELYQHVYGHVLQRWGSSENEISTYRNEYNKLGKRQWKIETRTSFFEQIEKAQVIVLGDFHSLQQSQKSHLRVVKNLREENFKFALECIATEHQEVVDQFVFEDLEEKEFLKKVHWKKNWGFPWEHFRDLFLYARQKRIRILALNSTKFMGFKDSMKKRDQLAAKIISKEIKKSSEKVIVIYGESHLTSKDFFKFPPRTKICKVFQNIDEIYFKLMDLNKEDEVDVISFNPREFCLMNVPPWVKWQSYLMYLEKKYDYDLQSEGIDFTDYVAQYIHVITKELKLNLSAKNLSVYTSEDFSFLKKMRDSLSLEEVNFYELLIEEEKSFYIPDLGIGYLGRLTINHASSLAMQYVYLEILKVRKLNFSFPRDFTSLIWLEGIGYFGSKLINPKRKTETIKDIKNKVLQFGVKDNDKEALKLALYQRAKELMILSGKNTIRSDLKSYKKSSYIQCANLLGSLIGEKLFKGYKNGFVRLDYLKRLLKKPIGTKGFDRFYYENLEIIENLPDTFKSKFEKL